MKITEIPFVAHTGITRNNKGYLELPDKEYVKNHLGTTHASALFCLAETASGDCLYTTFPELAEKVIPVLRNAESKFRKPVTERATAHPTIPGEEKDKFRRQLNKKGRAGITVIVEIRCGDVLSALCKYTWFIQVI